MTELERLRQEYNAAIANGLVLKARRINRLYQAEERRIAITGVDKWSDRYCEHCHSYVCG